MKFSIKKKLHNVSYDDCKKFSPIVRGDPIVDNDKKECVHTVSMETPFLKNPVKTQHKSKAPQAYGSSSTKNNLHAIKTTTKMKTKKPTKNNDKALNIGSATLKSIGVSFGNLFKPSVR